MRTTISSLVLVGAFALGAGCRTGANADPYSTAMGAVQESVGKGVQSSAATGPVRLPVRFNPSSCECPNFEIYAFGRWIRAFIDGASSAPVLDRLRAADDPMSEAVLNGQLADEIRIADNRVRYPVFVAQ